MAKTKATIALLLSALVFVAGCELLAAPQPKQAKKPAKEKAAAAKLKAKNAGMSVYPDPDGLFSIEAPTPWYANGGSSIAVELSPLRSNTTLRNERDTSVASVELRAGKVRQADDPAKMLKQTLDGMLASKPAAIRSKQYPIKIAGARGSWASIEMGSQSGEVLQIFVAIGGTGDRRMLMLGYSPKKNWNENVQIFKKMAESFKFTKKAT